MGRLTPSKARGGGAAAPGGEVKQPSRRGLSPLRGRAAKASAASPVITKAPPQPPAATPAAASARASLDDAASPPPTAPSESHVTVAVRIKPTDGAKTLMRFGPRAENALRFTHVEGGRSDEAKAFAYDHVFDQAESQSDVYRALGAKVLSEVVSGHNASVFAYGQTGSGKTHTMLGTPEERGLIPRLCEGLFKEESMRSWNMTLSFFEIYNEQVVDLLHTPEQHTPTSQPPPADDGASKGRVDESAKETAHQEWLGVGLDPKRRVPVLNALRVREHPTLGVYVEGLTKLPVHGPADVEAALERGASLRAVAETAMNAESSRSHAVVQLCCAEESSGDRTATLNLIDLAGSENVGRSRSHEDHSRLQEAKSINKSLLGLGKCIAQLAHGHGAPHAGLVPYRDSVLTWILKDALGGNAHTLMLCAVDPSPDNGEQTLTTLRYADQAKKITTRPVENIDHTKRMVRELHDQVAALRAEADAAAHAQKEARKQAAAAEAAAASAVSAAAHATAEREEAVAAAAAAHEAVEGERAELERWKEEAALREEALKAQAAEAAAAAEAAKAEEARVAEASSKAAKALTPRDRFRKKGGGRASGVAGGGAGGGDDGGGWTSERPVADEFDVAAVAAMSREEKRALAKRLKEERKALYVELGIEEEPKPPPMPTPPVAVPPPPPPTPPAIFAHAFKCLGLVFAVSVATDVDSSRSEASAPTAAPAPTAAAARPKGESPSC